MNRFYLLLIGLLLCIADVRAQAFEPKEENSLRVMCYNVRNCRGMDDVVDYGRIANIMNRVAPDVIAVQELDSVTERSKRLFTLQELANRTAMYPTYGAAISYQGGKYGIGILSKEKPLNHRTIALPGREEQRALLIAEFADYVLCCTHFSLTDADQLLSLPIIQEALRGITKPVILAGDMNSVPESPTQVGIREHFVTLNNPKTFTIPVVNPDRCIDFIYGLKNGNGYTLLHREVLTGEQVASDHLPLYVDVRFKAEAANIFRTTPYLQNPTGNGMTVSWLTNVPVHSWVEYGTSPALGSREELIVDGQIICNNKHHKIRLHNLTPGTTYYYRTCSREITRYDAYYKEFGETAHSEIHSFTMPAERGDFTAIILNDLHKNKPLLDQLSEQLKGVAYDFVLFNGDCLDDPHNEQEALSFLTHMNERVGAASKPIFILRGNHEIRNAYSIQMRDLFDYVGDKTYGAFNWGDTRFVMLDCGEDKPDSTWVYYGLNNFTQLRNDQVAFLQAELGSKAFKKAAKRVLIHHIPLYGMGEKSYQPSLHLWGPLLAKAPFQVCINAHTHRYAYHAKGTVGNPFPVVVGGGNRSESATVMFLQRKGDTLTLTVKNAKGDTLQALTL